MLMSEPARFIKPLVDDLDVALGKLKPNAKLTQLQWIWLGLFSVGKSDIGFGAAWNYRRYAGSG